ncbi:MAG: type IX secretion system membrane protein PorP/SprF [Bacteroidia bacterium]|nr:type IX secretion system membrane protein PorP/SprF [Bacteroidia bacterium]
MMKRNYIFVFFFLVIKGFAQQLPQYSQYMLNQMALNPAVAGKDDFSEVRSNSRLQWVGITDAPRTYMLTLQGPIKSKHMGIGMSLFTDIVGPTRRTGFNLSYAYHLKLKDDMHLSMGVYGGVLQWGIDGSKLTLHDDGDQQLLSTYQVTYVPDFGTGLYFYKKKRFYVGLSIPQLFQSQIKLYPGAYKNSKIVNHYNLNGAYTFDIGSDFKVEPSFLLKYEYPAPPKLDLGVRGIYKEQIWLGATFRTNDAASALIGYMHEDHLMIGYSYDFTMTRLKKYSGGTHEIMLGIKFSKKQAATWEKTPAVTETK